MEAAVRVEARGAALAEARDADRVVARAVADVWAAVVRDPAAIVFVPIAGKPRRMNEEYRVMT